jgi:carnitine 3-dehydrogenase
MPAAPGSSEAADREHSAPLRLHSCEIPEEWIDYNGHVTEFRYLQVSADATDALLAYLGMDADYLAAGGSYYTVETHICHLGQLYAGDRVEAITQLLGRDDKRLHVYHVMVREGEDQAVATGEHMLVHVETTADRAAPVRGVVRERVSALAAAHADLPRPARAGRRISL